MADVCEKHNVKLLTYGTLVGPRKRLRHRTNTYAFRQCGGFLADKWLGVPEPDLYGGNLTPSQRKVFRLNPCRALAGANTLLQYLDMIVKAWGDWSLFQELLRILRSIGDRHGGASIANIATRWVLDHPCVGAVIIGEIARTYLLVSHSHAAC